MKVVVLVFVLVNFYCSIPLSIQKNKKQKAKKIENKKTIFFLSFLLHPRDTVIT